MVEPAAKLQRCRSLTIKESASGKLTMLQNLDATKTCPSIRKLFGKPQSGSADDEQPRQQQPDHMCHPRPVQM
jgi:hypothetical protein